MYLLRIGATELLIILAIILLLFGPSRIAELMKSLGKGFRAFKKGLSEDDSDQNQEKSDK